MVEVKGINYGVVTNVDDPEHRGRIKCIIPEVIGAEVESAWCEPCINVAYDNGGDFCIPAIDETVWIVFVGGDPNKPVYLGGWWSKESVPKESYDELDNYRIISYADCKIVLVNGKIHIETAEDTVIEAEKDKVTLETSGGDTEVTIENKKVTIKGDLYVEGDIHSTQSIYADVNVRATQDVIADNNVNAYNSVNAPEGNIINLNSSKGKITSIESSNIQNSGEINTNSLDATSTNVNNETVGNLTANGMVSANMISANGSVSGSSVLAGNIDLANHTHNVTTTKDGGTYTTTVPM